MMINTMPQIITHLSWRMKMKYFDRNRDKRWYMIIKDNLKIKNLMEKIKNINATLSLVWGL